MRSEAGLISFLYCGDVPLADLTQQLALTAGRCFDS